MNANQFLIAILAGSAAALMSMGVAVSSSFSAIALFYLAALPLFILGLSNGVASAALGSAFAALIVLLLTNLNGALHFAFATGLPPVLLCRYALLRRPVPEAPAREGELRVEGFEWYPEGRLVLWCAALGVAFALVSVVVTAGFDVDEFRGVIRSVFTSLVDAVAKQEPDADVSGLLELGELAGVLVPPLSAIGLMVSYYASLRLAFAVTMASGRAIRPAGPFHSLRLPRDTGLALLASLAASFLPGFAGMAAVIAAAALFSAFVLAGLAVAQWYLKDHAARGALTFGLYFALTLLVWLVAPVLAGLGVADHYLRLRERKASVSPSSDKSTKE